MPTGALQDTKASYHHGGLPDTLMTLALEHIQDHGTEKLSLRALAREAGVSPTAPYRHFPTKKCLLAAMATQGFVRLSKRIRSVVSSDLGLEERFIGMGEAYIGFAVENPVAYQLMFGSILGDFSEYDMLRNASAQSYDEVLKVLQELIDAKGLQKDKLELGGMVWAAVHGIASLLLNNVDQMASSEKSSPQASLATLRQDPGSALRFMFSDLLTESNSLN